jgi:hypothetical protein
MSKFASMHDDDFGVICNILQEMFAKAPSVIKQRCAQFIDKGGMY